MAVRIVSTFSCFPLGQGVSIEAHGVVVLAHIIKAIEWFSRFYDANAPKAEDNPYGRRRGRW